MAGENNGVLELTQEDLDAQIEAAAQRAVAAEREKWQAEQVRRDAQFSNTRAELHARTVMDKVKAAQEAGLTPALCGFAEQVWLSDISDEGEQEPMITLSMPGEGDDAEPQDVEMTASEIADTFVKLIQQGAKDLTLGNVKPARRATTPGGKGTTKERAERLIEEMREGPTLLVND